jgi:hypothetical protein
VRLQKAQNDLLAAQNKRTQLAVTVLAGKDEVQATTFGQVFPPPPSGTPDTPSTPAK